MMKEAFEMMNPQTRIIEYLDGIAS